VDLHRGEQGESVYHRVQRRRLAPDEEVKGGVSEFPRRERSKINRSINSASYSGLSKTRQMTTMGPNKTDGGCICINRS